MRKLGLALVNILLFPLRKLPLRVHYALSGIVYFTVFKLLRYRYDDVMINLSRCFPMLNCYELRILCRQFYHHFADIIVEAVWFGGCTGAKRLRRARIMEVVNPEEVSRLYEKAPSMMVLYSHCGNWELYGGIESYTYDAPVPEPFHEDKFKVVYRAASSKFSDDFIKINRFAPLKDPAGFQGYIESKNLVRYALTHRDEKFIYNVNTDQRPYYAGSDNLEVTIIPDPEFKRQAKRLAKKYSSLKTDIQSLQNEIKENPLLGTDLGNNTHKVRMAILSKGKGKSGGARVITYVVLQEGGNYKVRLLTLYDKSEIKNVSDAYLRMLIAREP